MHSELIHISPELAAEWLSKNTFNRTLSRRSVDTYAADMRAGAWELTHQGIAFGADGVLVDGQHRLHAIVKAGVTIKMMVTWGAARTGIDQLRPRGHKDVIKFGGMSDWIGTREVQTARAMIEVDDYICARHSSVVSTHQLVGFAERNKDAILFIEGCFSSHRKGIAAALVRGVAGVASYTIQPYTLGRFIELLYTGLPEHSGEHAAIRLRDHLIAHGVKTDNGGWQERRQFAKLMMRYLDNFAKGLQTHRQPKATDFIFSLPAGRGFKDVTDEAPRKQIEAAHARRILAPA